MEPADPVGAGELAVGVEARHGCPPRQLPDQLDLPLTADVSRSDFAATVRRALDDKPKTGTTRLQMAPAMRPPDVSAFSSLFRHPQYGYYVFLYYQEP